MKTLKNVSLFLLVLVFASLLAYPIGKYFYTSDYQISFSSFIVPASTFYFINGIFLSYAFFLTLVFSAFGVQGKARWWWVGIGLVPVLIVELLLVPSQIYLPIMSGFVGWLLGLGVQKLISRRNSSV